MAITNSDSPYTVPVGISVVGVDTSGGAVTVILPDTATSSVTISGDTHASGYKIAICDEGGQAGTNNITVQPTGTNTIISESSVIIDGNYNSINVYSNGGTDAAGTWFIC